jgi:hypothetical protein
MTTMNPEKLNEKGKRKSIQELWDDSDRITQDILAHPWKHPLQYVLMVLGRMPDKEKKVD